MSFSVNPFHPISHWIWRVLFSVNPFQSCQFEGVWFHINSPFFVLVSLELRRLLLSSPFVVLGGFRVVDVASSATTVPLPHQGRGGCSCTRADWPTTMRGWPSPRGRDTSWFPSLILKCQCLSPIDVQAYVPHESCYDRVLVISWLCSMVSVHLLRVERGAIACSVLWAGNWKWFYCGALCKGLLRRMRFGVCTLGVTDDCGHILWFVLFC